MTETQVSARLALLRQRLWPRADLSRWVGIDLDANRPLIAQFHMWQSLDPEAAFAPPDNLDRWAFERFLTTKKYIGKRGAALALAVTEDCFTRIVQSAGTRNLLQKFEAAGETGVYRSDVFSDFHKHFAALRSTTFSDRNVYFEKLHREIERYLGVSVTPVTSVTADALGETEFATSLDALTEEPMGLRYQVYLETHKPIHLRPDSCSWLTFVRFEQCVRPALFGSPPDFQGDQRSLLEMYARQLAL